MDYSLDIYSAEILNFSPQKGRDYDKRKFIFWPAYAYRVLAPIETKQKLNGFQKAVLGFCRHNIVDPQKIGDSLHLESQLINYIQLELKKELYIDNDFRITPKGLDFLETEFDNISSKITVAYIFQDPFQDRLWPRVVSEKKLANVEFFGEDRYPRLKLGPNGLASENDPRPFVFQPDGLRNLPRTPEINEIIEAVKRHQREEAFFSKQDYRFEYIDEDQTGDIGERSDFASVDIISYEPQPCFLTSYIYIPKHPVEKDEWYVCDPFGRGESRLFRKWIEVQFDKHPPLHDEVKKLLNSRSNKINDIEAYFLRYEEQAQNFIINEFGKQIEKMPFYEWLLAMERVRQELKDLKSPPPDQIEACLINGTKALEALLGNIQSNFPPGIAWKIFDNRDIKFRADLLDQITGKLKFKKPNNLANIAYINPGNIRRVAETGGGTLNERIIVALLTARLNPDHPLHNSARLLPELLVNFQDISQMRGSSAHATVERLEYSRLEQLIQKLYKIIKALIPLNM